MNKQKGQGLVEIIFAVGVLIIVITAVVNLIVKTTGLKSLSLQRKRAGEMSEVVIEKLMNNKKNSPASFWELNDITTPQSVSGYDGYRYTVDFRPVTSGNCSAAVVECADAVIVITWGNNETLVINRFFSKKI